MAQRKSRAPCESAAQRTYERLLLNKSNNKSQSTHSVARISRSEAQKSGDSMIDPRLVFLERAAARLALIDAGAMTIEDAVVGLMPAILEIADCRCYLEILESFDRNRPKHKGAA